MTINRMAVFFPKIDCFKAFFRNVMNYKKTKIISRLHFSHPKDARNVKKKIDSLKMSHRWTPFNEQNVV